jgi:hypothetical protein
LSATDAKSNLPNHFLPAPETITTETPSWLSSFGRIGLSITSSLKNCPVVTHPSISAAILFPVLISAQIHTMALSRSGAKVAVVHRELKKERRQGTRTSSRIIANCPFIQ